VGYPSRGALSFFTSMFLHGGLLHLASNMWSLWIFGDNIEDRIGHAKFLVFYLVCGLAASVAHIMFDADSVIPSLGASGAIAGVLGAYLVLFPRRSVRVLVGRQVANMPAFMVLGLWILLQVFAQISVVGGSGGGVAYMAHIGGFVAGLALIFLFGRRVPSMPQLTR
jgi:membrane associated rhomboid family serine protease